MSAEPPVGASRQRDGVAAERQAVVDAAAAPAATIYTTPDCVQCVATKRAFEKLGVPYVLVDLSTDREARDMLANSGYRSAPVVIPSVGESWSGFRPDRIRTLSEPAVSASNDRAAAPHTRPAPAGPSPLDGAARAWAQETAARLRTRIRAAVDTGLSL